MREKIEWRDETRGERGDEVRGDEDAGWLKEGRRGNISGKGEMISSGEERGEHELARGGRGDEVRGDGDAGALL